VQAVMVAAIAQSGPRGASTPRRAALRDAALGLAGTIRDNKLDDARRTARSLPYLRGDLRAAAAPVSLLKHIEMDEAMWQFVHPRKGGLGLELKILKLTDARNKRRELLPAELDEDLLLLGRRVAVLAEWIKTDYKPQRKPKEWPARAEEARQAGLELAAAVKARNGKRAWQALSRLENACASCHDSHRD
jgi:hypothetical protein